MKMHPNESDIDEALIKELLSEQFPEWVALEIRQVQSAGTDNVIYRLGDTMCMRLPRMLKSSSLGSSARVPRTPESASDVLKEQKWLPVFASHLPLLVPALLGKGEASEHYPLPWSIYSWIEGDTAASVSIADSHEAAIALAEFLNTLQKIDTIDAPYTRRGLPLTTQDEETRAAIQSLTGMIDTTTVTAIWNKCLAAPEWDQSPVWLHGDLLPTNLIVKNNKLHAVIDFGLSGIGDPACDIIAAWSIFNAETRNVFRKHLDVDDATWLRGKGWALSIALVILPYYMNPENSNPGLVAVAKRILSEIINEI